MSFLLFPRYSYIISYQATGPLMRGKNKMLCLTDFSYKWHKIIVFQLKYDTTQLRDLLPSIIIMLVFMSYLRRVLITVRRVKTHFANIHLYLLAARSNENVWKITKRRENENTDHWVTAPLIPQSGRRRLWVLAYASLSGEQKWCVFEVKGGRGVTGFQIGLCTR